MYMYMYNKVIMDIVLDGLLSYNIVKELFI